MRITADQIASAGDQGALLEPFDVVYTEYDARREPAVVVIGFRCRMTGDVSYLRFIDPKFPFGNPYLGENSDKERIIDTTSRQWEAEHRIEVSGYGYGNIWWAESVEDVA